MNLDRGVISVLQTYTHVSRVIDRAVVKMSVYVGAEPADRLWMNGDMAKDNFMAFVIFLDYVGPYIIEKWNVVLKFKNVMVAFYQNKPASKATEQMAATPINAYISKKVNTVFRLDHSVVAFDDCFIMFL